MLYSAQSIFLDPSSQATWMTREGGTGMTGEGTGLTIVIPLLVSG
ncbi:hypothetical protein [Wolbachia endosymbiont of Drosophila tsacasi]|nr:hypothetical protein [Wolbachia endosymbiont of Drosophila tsacasi]MDE5062135.1 hypothetical protein [Wolbachia endosymbiont of Drosophila tsacasi]